MKIDDIKKHLLTGVTTYVVTYSTNEREVLKITVNKDDSLTVVGPSGIKVSFAALRSIESLEPVNKNEFLNHMDLAWNVLTFAYMQKLTLDPKEDYSTKIMHFAQMALCMKNIVKILNLPDSEKLSDLNKAKIFIDTHLEKFKVYWKDIYSYDWSDSSSVGQS